MRIFKASLCIIAGTLVMGSPVQADDSSLCNVYGSIGGSLTEFALPLTMQQFIDMVGGNEPELMNEMTMVLMSDVSGADLMSLANLGSENAELLGTAAGQVAIELLTSAQANSSEQVKSIMIESCNQVGPMTIIENQQKANAATAANMGQ